MSFPNSQLEIINSLKPSKPSRYYRLENVLIDVAIIIILLIGFHYVAYCDTFPALKSRGKYTLRIDNSFTYSVRKNFHYEVDGHYKGGI